MKYLFLDIDGVLNSHAWNLRRCGDCSHEVELGFGRCEACDLETQQDVTGQVRLRRCFDPEAVARLNRFVQESGVHVVVSSAWRIAHTLTEIEGFLRDNGYTGPRLFSCTPRLYLDRPSYVPPDDPGVTLRQGRGLEIEAWLHEMHPDPVEREWVRFAIVDDDSDMGRLTPWHVQTSWESGLLDEHLPKLAEKLEKYTDGLLRERHPMLRGETES